MSKPKIAVIGGGAAGVMAALRCVLNNDQCLFFPGTSKDRKKSRAMWVRKVENIPGFHQYAKGIDDPNTETLKWISESEFSENLLWFKNTGIVEIVKKQNNFCLKDSHGNEHQAQYVILCTGIMDTQPHILGSIAPILPFANKQSVDYCLRCDGHHVKGKKTFILGHSDIAAWVAIILFERYRPPELTILTHGELPQIAQDTQKILEAYKINVITSDISKVLGDVKAGQISGFEFTNHTTLSVDIGFISLGIIAYNQLAQQLGAELDSNGRVITDAKGESSVQNFFVAGDLRANGKMQIYTAWDQAVDSADVCNSRIRRIMREEMLPNN